MLPRTILLILAVITISGCTTGPAIGGGAGIVFESFEADFTDVFIQEPVTLTAKIRNMATADSGPVFMRLIGIEEEYVDESTCDSGFDSLFGADPVYGTQGETQICHFKLIFPEGTVSEGLSTTFQPAVRLEYQFISETVKTITVASQSELRAIQNSGGSLPIETTSSTGGPISISVKSIGPIRLFEGTSTVTVPIEIEITNIGGGTTYYGDTDPDNWNIVSLDLSSPSQDVTPDSQCRNKIVPLFRGQSSTVVCRLDIGTGGVLGPTQKLISVSADYGYFADRSLTLNVHYRET